MSETNTNTNEKPKKKFGITAETKESNFAPLLVPTKVETTTMFPSGWKFPVVRLVNVIDNPAHEKKDGSIVSTLSFVFKDADGRQYTHTEWEVNGDDTKYDIKEEGLFVRLKHIYTAIFSTFPKEGVGTGAENWKEFFNLTAIAFNNVTTGEGKDIKKVYYSVSLYIKVVYFKAKLGFPLSPNFLEKVEANKGVRILTVNTSYDKLEPSITNKKSTDLGTPPADDLPVFGEYK